MTESQSQRRPIFILGTDRSGTSLLSEVLFRWGANPGEMDRLPEADIGNPQGYWEYGPMEDFVADLLNNTGPAFWSPQFKELLRQHAFTTEWRQKALTVAADMERPGKPWFWKEPALSYMLPFFSEIFADPVYLIALRDPCNSALSYEKFFLPSVLRDKIRLISFFFLQWQHLMIAIFEHLKDYKSKIIVPYEALVSSPHGQCERIYRFLAAEYGPAAPSDPATVDRMAEAINSDLWRNRSTTSFFEAQAASPAQKELYSYLSSRVDGDVSDFDPALYPFPACSEEYLSNMMVVKWLFQNL